MFVNKVKNVQPLIPGGTTVITLATGQNAPTLDRLQFKLNNGGSGVFDTTKIDAIRCYTGAGEFYTAGSATDHNKRRSYKNRRVSTDELVIDYTEPDAKSGIEQFLSSVPLSLTNSFKVELDINATASAAMKLECWAHFRAPTTNPLIKKLKRMTAQFSAGSTRSSPNTIYLPAGKAYGGKLYRVWIKEGSAGNITEAELRVKNSVGFEQYRVQTENTQSDFKWTPQAGWYVLDFIQDGNLAGWLDTSAATDDKDVELNLVQTAGDSLTVYLEMLDAIAK
jgi:hypothetical protein